MSETDLYQHRIGPLPKKVHFPGKKKISSRQNGGTYRASCSISRKIFFPCEPVVLFLLLYLMSIASSKVTILGLYKYTQLEMLTHYSTLRGSAICHAWSRTHHMVADALTKIQQGPGLYLSSA